MALQAPLSMEFSRQEYWSDLPFPSPGDLPNQGIKIASLMPPALAGSFFTTSATWEALCMIFLLYWFIWWITVIYFYMLKQSCILGKHAWILYIYIYIYIKFVATCILKLIKHAQIHNYFILQIYWTFYNNEISFFPFLSLVIGPILKSTLSDINIAIPAFYA